jgi:hypothetical protein
MMNRKGDTFQIRVQRPHLVLLGAGASVAAFPKGDKNGLVLPLMNNFVETVEGLGSYLDKFGISYEGQNFEDIYSTLYEDSKYDEIRTGIEELVYDYFAHMELPDEPTLYDHLVLSLTGRDAIATFNWDPFLWQAICRNYDRVGDANLPRPIYLHGNAAVGFCINHEKVQISHKGHHCRKCGSELQKSKLLYPIRQKNYNTDPFIKSSWSDIGIFLQDAYMFTIFGYGAPSSDVEAVGLLSQAWGDKYQRSMEQIELIDKIDESAVCKRWEKFIHTHHYGYHNNFYSSMIAKCSRRSADASFGANYDCIAWEEHPIPKDMGWEELDEWLKPLLAAENEARSRARRRK